MPASLAQTSAPGDASGTTRDESGQPASQARYSRLPKPIAAIARAMDAVRDMLIHRFDTIPLSTKLLACMMVLLTVCAAGITFSI